MLNVSIETNTRAVMPSVLATISIYFPIWSTGRQNQETEALKGK